MNNKSREKYQGEKKQVAVKKEIPQWPHICNLCGSGAVIFTTRIDCSNQSCKNRYVTNQAKDLFLPIDNRPPGWAKDPNRKRRNGVDNNFYVKCPVCQIRATNYSFIALGRIKAECTNNHAWESELNIGDKILFKNNTYAYKGKNVFVKTQF